MIAQQSSEIAIQDSGTMKAIAILGLLFLPATLTAVMMLLTLTLCPMFADRILGNLVCGPFPARARNELESVHGNDLWSDIDCLAHLDLLYESIAETTHSSEQRLACCLSGIKIDEFRKL